MKNMTRVLAVGSLLLLGRSGYGMEVVRKDNMDMDIAGRIQLFGLAENVDDKYRDDRRLYLFLKQARLALSGRYERYDYRAELAFAGEEEVKAPNPGVSLNLLDLYVDAPLWRAARVRIGQFKVPYSRERLASSANLVFADRSIQNLGFRMGRDVGAAVHASRGFLTGTIGAFVGGGRDVPERYLPQELGTPMVAARIGISGLDEGPFAEAKEGTEPTGTRAGAFVNAVYLKDSKIGHSTVLNVKLSEKSLLLNPNWNPYIAKTPLDPGDLVQGGADLAMETPVGPWRLSAGTEVNYGRQRNVHGTVELAGGQAQVALSRNPVDVALRYAILYSDDKVAFGATRLMGTTPIQELTPALTYHLKGRWARITLDLPVLIDVPVVTETGIGSYVLTEQPDQSSALAVKGSTFDRQTVVQGRLLFQIGF